MRYVIEEIEVGKSEAALKRIKNKIRSFYQTFEKKWTKKGDIGSASWKPIFLGLVKILYLLIIYLKCAK